MFQRQAAYFDFGLEHGIATAAANGLTKASPTQRSIAERIVQEVFRTGVARDDAVRAAVLAVWGLTGSRSRSSAKSQLATTDRLGILSQGSCISGNPTSMNEPRNENSPGFSAKTGTLGVVLGPVICEAVGRTRMQYALQYLKAAAFFSRHVRDLEITHADEPIGSFFEEILWNAVPSIVLAATSVEARVNELVVDSPMPSARAGETRRPNDSSNRTLRSIADLVRSSGKEPVDLDAMPWSEFLLLASLRNKLIHFSPEWHDEEGVHRALSNKLVGKFLVSAFLRSEAIFPRAWASSSCTRWAVATSVSTLDAIDDALGREKTLNKHRATIEP